MHEHKFNNQYKVIIFALSNILDQLERKHQIFAAQCVWWLASVIQYTEILLFYRQFNIFPSYWVTNCIVTPLPGVNTEEYSEQDIPELGLAEEIIEERERPSLRNNLAKSRTLIGLTRSRRVVKPQKINQQELAIPYPGKTNNQLQVIRNLLRKDGIVL